MEEEKKIAQRGDARAYLWLAAFALLAFPAKAGDFSVPHYLLNFVAVCLIFLFGTLLSRSMPQTSWLREPIRLLTLVTVLALLLFPMRSEGTPIWMFVVVFATLYVSVLLAAMLYKKVNRS